MDRRRAASLVVSPGHHELPPGLSPLPPSSEGPRMLQQLRNRYAVTLAVTAAAASASIAYAAGDGPISAGAKSSAARAASDDADGGGSADVHLFAPKSGDRAGLDSKGFFIDLKADLDVPLARSGFGGQGPATGIGADKRFPGLIVLLSGTKAGAGKNLAGLFDVVGVTNQSPGKTQLWATWKVAKPNFGSGPSTVYVAVAGDRDHDGVLDDAPGTVADADGDGDVDEKDLQAVGRASEVRGGLFVIN